MGIWGLTGVCSQRSWNFFQGDIDDAKIRAQIDAMLVKRPVAGKQPMSLLDLGYNHVRSSKSHATCAVGAAAR
jgi:hypothetical protein